MSSSTDKHAPMQTAWTCPHLRAFWKNGGLRDLVSVREYLKLAKDPSSSFESPCCQKCTKRLVQLHACVHCVFIGCTKYGHMADHQDETDHYLSIDVRRGRFHCKRCNDYVYDWELQSELLEQQRSHDLRIQLAKRRNVHWQPNDQQKQLLRAYSSPVRDHNNTLGLRGILNLGNSCFMTVVIQALVQNPFLRNFFLGDLHHPRLCPRKAKNLSCLACEMDKLYHQIFNGATNPLSPHRILYAIWKQSKHLSGYRQQDAHEFLASVLDGLHLCLCCKKRGATSTSKINDSVIHRIFGGRIRSDVWCHKCQRCSTSKEPVFYICLDVYYKVKNIPSKAKVSPSKVTSNGGRLSVSQSPQMGVPVSAMSVSPNANGKVLARTPSRNGESKGSSSAAASPSDGSSIGGKDDVVNLVDGSSKKSNGKSKKRMRSSPSGSKSSEKRAKLQPVAFKYLRFVSLHECLKKYVAKEILGKADQVYCPRCQTYTTCSKQMRVERLPPTLSFQLKRFSQNPVNKRWFKINSYVSFPLDGLNLSSYMYHGDEKENGKKSEENYNPELYDLGSVIVHKGTLENGHYICYIRRKNQWYKCDDSIVTKVSPDEVRECEAYLLFYIRRSIAPSHDSWQR
mmetsp:Transcript_12334/g.18401  ORF Transcript_12334/g.18401 Transcript_12334/m.18401 type:complete len:624 (-) Transcript_12334:65-1936(-)